MPKITRDGIGLAYEEAGSGKPHVLMCHCWGGDRTFMKPQFDHFKRTHRAVSVDLRGFGDSDKPDGEYTIKGFADDLGWMIQHLQLDKPVLVGHSMGGTVVLEAAARHPELVSAIVILEALVVSPPGLVDGFRPVLEAIKTPAYAGALTQFTEQLTGPLYDADARTRMTATMIANSPRVMISSLQDLLSYDSASAAAHCKVPVLYVSSGPWYTDVDRFRSLCPTLTTAQLVGCGHYFELEVPDQLHPIIDRFLEIQVQR